MKKLALLAFAVASAVVSADSYKAPWTRVFVSDAGTYAFRVVPPQKWTMDGRATGVLFTYDLQGRERVLWKSTLVNLPSSVVVTESGRVATINTYARSGYAHSLVVYGDRGQVLKDYRLEDLLTAAEIGKVPTTVSSRWWADASDAQNDTSNSPNWGQVQVGQAKVMRPTANDLLLVKTKVGRTLKVDLASGKLLD